MEKYGDERADGEPVLQLGGGRLKEEKRRTPSEGRLRDEPKEQHYLVRKAQHADAKDKEVNKLFMSSFSQLLKHFPRDLHKYLCAKRQSSGHFLQTHH